MAKTKEERWQYTDKRITIEGQTFDVTLAFPVPMKRQKQPQTR